MGIEQATKNALMALEIAGSYAKVYKGSDERYGGQAIEAFSVFGEDGMGDMELIHPLGQAEETDAVDFILQTVKEYPGEVEIISLGPATNIAKAMDRDPEAMKQVKMIWSMGSAGLGPGNASPVAEFNVYSDAPAYKRMLDSGCPVTVIGLDVCGEQHVSPHRGLDALGSFSLSGEDAVYLFLGKDMAHRFFREHAAAGPASSLSVRVQGHGRPAFVPDSLSEGAFDLCSLRLSCP